MSKVTLVRVNVTDSGTPTTAQAASGWKGGAPMTFDSTGNYITQAAGNNTMFVVVEDSTYTVSALFNKPPSGTLLTTVYGGGTVVLIDHASEVASSSSSRVYNTATGNPESASASADIYVDATGLYTTASGTSTYPLFKLWQVPAAGNNYQIGLKFINV